MGVQEKAKDAAKDSNPAGHIERQLAAAQKITHIGSWEWNAATGQLAWSDELFRIYGLEPQSLVLTFEAFLARVHPDDRERTQRKSLEALRTGGRFEYPERIIRPDGSVRDLATVGEALHDASGAVTGLIGTCRDVTEQRAHEEQIQQYANIVGNIQIGLFVFQVKDSNDMQGIRLLNFNPAAERAAGRPLAPLVKVSGDVLLDVIGRGEVPRLLMDVARDDVVRELNAVRFKEGWDPSLALSFKAFPLPGCCVGLAAEDVTIQARAREQLAIEREVLEMVAQGCTLEDVLRTLAEGIERQAPAAMASVQLLDETGQCIVHGAAPHLPEAYNRAIDGLPVGPAAGSCGTAIFRREAVFVADIETDPLWEAYRDLARTHGLRACWSTPIFTTDRRVLGTFALYYRSPHTPSPAERSLIERATHVAGIAIQRRQLDDQMRALSARIESAREDERTGIAREIHDELGQTLTALKLDMSWIVRRAQGADAVSNDSIIERVRGMIEMTDDLIKRVRRICSELRPGVLDDLGLVAALEWEASEFERRTDIPCTVSADPPDVRLDKEVSTAVFRIFQEALTNVARHAHANCVDASLVQRDGFIDLEVRDDGRGIDIDAQRNPKSLGLLGIRERARRVGGSASIEAGETHGTVVLVHVPISTKPLEGAR